LFLLPRSHDEASAPLWNSAGPSETTLALRQPTTCQKRKRRFERRRFQVSG
jgi:hypothetical protein